MPSEAAADSSSVQLTAPAWLRPVPPAPPKKYTGWVIVLGIVSAVATATATAVVVFMVKDATDPEVVKERTGTLSLPDSIGGFNRLDDPGLQRLVSDRETAIRAADVLHTIRDFVGEYYAPPEDLDHVATGDLSHAFLIEALTGYVGRPAPVLDHTFHDLAESHHIGITTPRDVPAGTLGGKARCATGSINASVVSIPVTLCVWADRGSIGIAYFYDRPFDPSAQLFIEVRSAVLHRS